MQSTTTTNALLSIISILVLVILIVMGPGGCKDQRLVMPGRYQVVNVPGPDGGPAAPLVVDTATGSAKPLQVEPVR